MSFITYYTSPLEKIILASNGSALTGVWFDGQKHFASTLLGNEQIKDLPVFDQAKRWLDIYFDRKIPDFTPPLHLRGSDFRKTVWNILLTIPYGQTTSYGEITARFSGRMSSQAIGGAVGHNPISLIVPCHRVIGSNGKLTGYAGGIGIENEVARMEKINPRFTIKNQY